MKGCDEHSDNERVRPGTRFVDFARDLNPLNRGGDAPTVPGANAFRLCSVRILGSANAFLSQVEPSTVALQSTHEGSRDPASGALQITRSGGVLVLNETQLAPAVSSARNTVETVFDFDETIFRLRL